MIVYIGAAAREYGQEETGLPFHSINGAVHHYRLGGADADRPAIVFANSLGTDLRIWDEVAPALGGDHRILTYDKRGHGLSELGDAPQDIGAYAADLAGLLEHCGISSTVICGLSIGGLIAQALYAQRPELVRGIVFCDTAHKVGSEEIWNGRIAAAASPGIESFADGVMEKWFTPAFHRDRAADLAGYRCMLARQSPAGYAAACAAIRDADFTGTAAHIRVPSLVVVGDQDGSTPPALVESFARMIPDARFEVIADAGHIPCVEQPAALVRLIRGFTADLERKAA